MTRRRNPPPRPLRPNRSKKDQEQLDNDLRVARANRRAENHQKQMLRRREWDQDGADDAEDLPMESEADDEEATDDDDDDDDTTT
jgi:hypothetical protein